MVIDFSILNDIDFTNPANLWFLLLFSFLAIILFIILILFIAWIIKIIKKIKNKIAIKMFDAEVKAPKFGLPQRLGRISQPQNFNNEVSIGGKAPDKTKSEDENKNRIGNKISENQPKGVDDKNIQEGLSKLKSNNFSGEKTLESKMPSRTETGNMVGENLPVPKHSLAGGAQRAVKSYSGSEDSSIFKGEPLISKAKFEEKVRSDSAVWKAASQEGLALSPLERSKLAKEVLSHAGGESISKIELKQGISKLNQKLSGAKNPQEHAKIRKEVKFFKKIGGIK